MFENRYLSQVCAGHIPENEGIGAFLVTKDGNPNRKENKVTKWS